MQCNINQAKVSKLQIAVRTISGQKGEIHSWQERISFNFFLRLPPRKKNLILWGFVPQLLSIFTVKTSALFSASFSSTMAFTIVLGAVTLLAFASWSSILLWDGFASDFIVAAVNARTLGRASSSSFKALAIVLLALGPWTVALGSLLSFIRKTLNILLISCWLLYLREGIRLLIPEGI